MTGWRCPLCGGQLKPEGNSLRCENRHTFDRGKSGYVNLLLVNEKRSKIPGDNKLMVNARREFLDKGYYAPLAEEFSSRAAETMEKIQRPVVLDAGCGEGYYTAYLKEALEKAGCEPQIFAADISKFAADKCARRCKEVECAAASVFRLPLADQSCDLITCLFAPYAGEEFRRVLKPGGIFLMVIPGENHLWELKEAIYDKPYRNEVKDYQLEGFTFLDRQTVDRTILLDNPADIRSLFQMTPYYYKSGVDTDARLEALTRLETQISFEILTYQATPGGNSPRAHSVN